MVFGTPRRGSVGLRRVDRRVASGLSRRLDICFVFRKHDFVSRRASMSVSMGGSLSGDAFVNVESHDGCFESTTGGLWWCEERRMI